MTIEKIREMVSGEEYDFLRTNSHLGNRVVLLTLGGSYAYGTNIETSDVDVRGCALNSPSDIIGLSEFDQFVNETTDTTIYSFNKLVGLLLNCNPNTIEILGCKPEHYLIKTGAGAEMIDRRKMFLSQRAITSFGGYATQQLRRLENALAHDRLPQSKTEEHIRGALERALKVFEDKYRRFDEESSIHLFTDKSEREELETEVFCDITLKRYPAREFVTMLNSLSSVVDTYGKLNHRNRKKDNLHLNKHAMHLIRLYLMLIDILENEEIVTYRSKNRDLLLSIRKGEFQNEDGTYRDEFFEMISELESRIDYAKRNTSLPRHPNIKDIEEFVMNVNRKSLDL